MANINHINPLYICDDDPDNPKTKVLQTDGCDADDPSVELAEVSAGDLGGSGILGRWNLPVKIFLHRVPRPDVVGDPEPPTTCNPDPWVPLPKGCACTIDDDCSSKKCKGGAGSKTCK